MKQYMSEYEKFVFLNSSGSFTQSENWCKIKNEWKSERIIIRDESGNIIGTMQILIKNIPLMNTVFMYAPRGPVCDCHNLDILSKIIEQAKLLAEKHKAYMLKIDPMISYDDIESINNLKRLGFKYNANTPEDNTIQCQRNYILDIKNKTEDEIFSSFHSKWRYNIRLAVRKGVSCKYYGVEKLDDFCELMQVTGKRDGFAIRSKEYFEKFLSAFEENARLYMCYSPDGEAISGALTVRYGNRVSYVYGASSDTQRNLMPNYLMQWNMIKWAIESQCDIYDFMGIPHCDEENHSNYGVYRFKKGFNGEIVKYAGEFDYIFSNVKHTVISFLLHSIGYTKL